MSPVAGMVLSNRYALTARIAAGGMGEVWAATDTVLGRTVAVKLLSSALSEQSGFLDRFRAEARYSAALHHPNITTVFDYGEDDGSAYLVMELVAGQPLSQLIAERAPMSAHTTASVLIQAATALEAAHQSGVVHRDVKPANILITPDGTAKLTDFGISRLISNAPLTQAGQVLGTAQYLSPEQAMGQSATAASDIYALGVVGHEMLTGHPPFNADTLVATALAHLNQPPPPLPDTVPVGIRNVIAAALAKDPADRPATAAAMARELRMPDAAFAAAAGSPPALPSTAPSASTPVTPEAGAAALPTTALSASALAAGALAAGALSSGALSSGALSSGALPALATAGPAPAARTPMPVQAAQAAHTPAFDLATRTQVMPVLPGPAERPDIHDRRRGLRPAWLLAGAAAAMLFVLVAFALPGNDQSVQTPVVPVVTATTSPTPIQDGANESTTTEVARPAEDSPTPAQAHRTRGRARGHDQNKDGK